MNHKFLFLFLVCLSGILSACEKPDKQEEVDDLFSYQQERRALANEIRTADSSLIDSLRIFPDWRKARETDTLRQQIVQQLFQLEFGLNDWYDYTYSDIRSWSQPSVPNRRITTKLFEDDYDYITVSGSWLNEGKNKTDTFVQLCEAITGNPSGYKYHDSNFYDQVTYQIPAQTSGEDSTS